MSDWEKWAAITVPKNAMHMYWKVSLFVLYVKYFILEVSTKEICKEKVRGRSRNTDKGSNLSSNSSSGPTSFRRKMGSLLAVRFKWNSVSLTGLVCFFLAGAVSY